MLDFKLTVFLSAWEGAPVFLLPFP